MKFIDFETLSATHSPSSPAIAPTSKTTASTNGKLIARWDMVNGKLTCKWVIE
jgi:hypothetical protein